MATLLITGAQRPVAANLAVVLSSAFDVVAVCDALPPRRQAKTTLPRLQGCQVTLAANAQDAADLIHGIGPQAVIHCGGLSASAWEATEFNANSDSAFICSAAQAACHVEAHFTLISTDAVFDRPHLFHKEGSRAESTDAPWIHSLESAALEWGGLVLRTHALAWSATPSATLSERLYESLHHRTALSVNPAAYATPVLVDDLAEGWLRAFDRQLRGVLHLAGSERVGQLRFVRSLATELDQAESLEELLAYPNFAATHHRETSLCSRRACDLVGWRPLLFGDALRQFASQCHDGRWDALGRTVKSTPTAQAA
ncbi:MAG: sugar nucleotide-binding protein [Pirellulales bacterium]|nr:sugar nucleotide-binding protein [Pirellulales bacterium]